MTTRTRSRREIREDASRDMLEALRAGGEMTTRQLANETGHGTRLVESVCRELEFCREVSVRRLDQSSLWRLPGQEPDLDARLLLGRCRSLGIDAEVSRCGGARRIRAPHPFSDDGWVWIDCEGDADWYAVERAVVV